MIKLAIKIKNKLQNIVKFLFLTIFSTTMSIQGNVFIIAYFRALNQNSYIVAVYQLQNQDINLPGKNNLLSHAKTQERPGKIQELKIRKKIQKIRENF